MQITGNDQDLQAYPGVDFAITWSALGDASSAFYQICQNKRVLALCDEHHHAGRDAAWGDGADNAFADAKYTLVLTGTPIRSDGSESVWMAYDNRGRIDHPSDGTFTLSYGEAVDLGYCRLISRSIVMRATSLSYSMMEKRQQFLVRGVQRLMITFGASLRFSALSNSINLLAHQFLPIQECPVPTLIRPPCSSGVFRNWMNCAFVCLRLAVW